MRQAPDPSEIVVIIEHPFGSVDVPLQTWMSSGPGLRSKVAVHRAKHIDGSPLPIEVVPLRYRNNLLSRMLIRLHILQDPWKQAKQKSQVHP